LILFCLAYSTALNATEAGSEPAFDFIIVAPTRFDHSSSCSIAAALKVSHAENIT
jgi:hypothetical protein